MKRIVLTAAAVYVIGFAMSFVAHGVLLTSDYQKIASIMRSEAEMQSLTWLMFLGYIFWAGAIAWMYRKGVEDKGWVGQGVRFGLAISAIALVPAYVGYYVTQPWPASLVVKGLIADTVCFVVVSIVAAGMNRNQAGAPIARSAAV